MVIWDIIPSNFCQMISYGIHFEVTQGKIGSGSKYPFPVNFWAFRDILSLKMRSYNPIEEKYLGDADKRLHTKQNMEAINYNKKDSYGEYISSGSKTGQYNTTADVYMQ